VQHAEPTGQDRKAATLVREAAAAESEGLVEIAILSLAGLTLSVMLLAQGFLADVLLLSAQ
jgi:hypothetical protein